MRLSFPLLWLHQNTIKCVKVTPPVPCQKEGCINQHFEARALLNCSAGTNTVSLYHHHLHWSTYKLRFSAISYELVWDISYFDHPSWVVKSCPLELNIDNSNDFRDILWTGRKGKCKIFLVTTLPGSITAPVLTGGMSWCDQVSTLFLKKKKKVRVCVIFILFLKFALKKL